MLHRLIPRRPSHVPEAIALAAAALAVLVLVFWAPPARGAAQVLVNFVEPQRYADIGRLAADRERALRALELHLRSLAARLPDGAQLRIEVLDVDLAGELYPTPRIEEQRVLRGRADWPRMHLRWALTAPGEAPRSGDDQLADMNYFGTVRSPDLDAELAYEKRMLDAWFAARFGSAQP